MIEILKTIGTEIISAIIGLIIGGLGGGAIGYKIASKNKAKQTQNAGDNSTQSQMGNITVISNNKGGKNER